MNKNLQRLWSFKGLATNKRGTILIENVIFIVLNLVFLFTLFLFLFSKMGSAAVLEEKYAKQIALIIDTTEPGMKISLDMSDAIEKAKKEKTETDIVSIQENVVILDIRGKKGYSYSFFNDVNVTNYFSGNDLILFIEEKTGI